jgi:hypothetical protein
MRLAIYHIARASCLFYFYCKHKHDFRSVFLVFPGSIVPALPTSAAMRPAIYLYHAGTLSAQTLARALFEANGISIHLQEVLYSCPQPNSPPEAKTRPDSNPVKSISFCPKQKANGFFSKLEADLSGLSSKIEVFLLLIFIDLQI